MAASGLLFSACARALPPAGWVERGATAHDAIRAWGWNYTEAYMSSFSEKERIQPLVKLATLAHLARNSQGILVRWQAQAGAPWCSSSGLPDRPLGLKGLRIQPGLPVHAHATPSLAGSLQASRLWLEFLQHMHALVLVVDSCDRDRLQVLRLGLHRLLEEVCDGQVGYGVGFYP